MHHGKDVCSTNVYTQVHKHRRQCGNQPKAQVRIHLPVDVLALLLSHKLLQTTSSYFKLLQITPSYSPTEVVPGSALAFPMALGVQNGIKLPCSMDHAAARNVHTHLKQPHHHRFATYAVNSLRGLGNIFQPHGLLLEQTSKAVHKRHLQLGLDTKLTHQLLWVADTAKDDEHMHITLCSLLERQ